MDHAADAFRTDLMTITRYLLKEQSRHLESRGDFTILLSHIVLGCKFVTLNKAGQAKLIGLSVQSNVQCVLVSEEDEEASYLDRKLRGKYCVCFDPLDGSSNINSGMPIGMNYFCGAPASGELDGYFLKVDVRSCCVTNQGPICVGS
ncbi:fructose-1,6-bisphosphatase, cytosolic-like [Aegilops tauschii subsp. strangulata]|uniref:fructose-1,6-bisphosphatase, cytosolic-like n=1 Tax=Aegilops tauschii subsp. strangulata TaxID=200361 RepID=UPI00098B4042